MNGIYDEARVALHAIWTRRWLALAIAWGVCVLGWLFVSQIPSRYESRARVFVQMQNLLPASMDQPSASSRDLRVMSRRWAAASKWYWSLWYSMITR